MEDTYTVLRHFADSWWLLGMMTFFLGAVAAGVQRADGSEGPRHEL